MIKNIKWLFLVSLTFVACNNNDDAVIDQNSSDGQPLTAGSANFSKYVALGDSFAAGFCDNALFIEGQKGAYPNILAQQFALVGGGSFTTPFMADNVGGFLGSSTYTPRLYLAPPTSPGASPSPSSVALPPYSQSASTTFASLGTSLKYNNMGIPGAKCSDLDFPGYGSSLGNPYFARFASNPMATIVDDALAQSPTFFSLWIGGNDVLGYAATGGLNDAAITPTTTFDTSYNSLINKLTSGGRKGVIANLPYINTLPLFTTVPYNSANIPSANVTALNTAYNAYNTGIANAYLANVITLDEKNKRTINFVAGLNPLVIIDETLTNLGPSVPRMRMATNNDYILLSSGGVSAQSHILALNGITSPLADNWVLTEDEVQKIKTATDAYNATIAAAATSKNLAIFDAKETMRLISTTGITANGYNVNSTYVSGGAFSLDGVHPSPRGYAVIANEFIKAINSKYGSNLKGVDLSKYRIMFPPQL